MIDEIKHWFASGQDFAAGRALYEKHGTDPALKILFSLKESQLSRKKLSDALQGILDIAPKPTITKMKPTADDATAPDEVKDLVNRRRHLYSEANRLHAVLFHQAITDPAKFTDEDRGKLANALLKVWDEIGSIWYKTNHYDEKGSLPTPIPEVDIIPKNGELALRAVLNHRSKLSKARKGRLKHDVPTLEAQLQALERILEEEYGDDTIETDV